MATVIVTSRVAESVLLAAKTKAENSGTTISSVIQRNLAEYAGLDHQPLAVGLAGASAADRAKVAKMGADAKKNKKPSRKKL